MEQPYKHRTTHRTIGNWSFVNTTGPRGAMDARSRRLIRVNAMRDYWRQTKLEGRIHWKKMTSRKCVNGGRPEASTGKTNSENSGATASGSEEEPYEPIGIEISATTLEAKDHQPYSTERAANPDTTSQILDTSQPQRNRTSSQRYGHDHLALRSKFDRNPIIIVGDGVSEPFNALPVEDTTRYDNYVLSQCRLPLSSFHLFMHMIRFPVTKQ